MIKDEEVYSSIDDYQSSSANNHQHNDSSSSTTIDTQGFSGATNNEQTMKQITNIEYSYDGADTVKSSISLDDEYHVLNKYPITTVIQYVFYGTLLLTVLSALSLIVCCRCCLQCFVCLFVVVQCISRCRGGGMLY